LWEDLTTAESKKKRFMNLRSRNHGKIRRKKRFGVKEALQKRSIENVWRCNKFAVDEKVSHWECTKIYNMGNAMEICSLLKSYT